MDSSSTYTYREHAQEYISTSDASLWYTQYLQCEVLQRLFKIPQIAVRLTDQPQSPVLFEIPTQTLNNAEEALMEPLLYVPESCKSTIYSIPGTSPDDILVALSIYGSKDLIFRLPGCLLCIDGEHYAMYVPWRLVKKVEVDLIAKGVPCIPTHHHPGATYIRVPLPVHDSDNIKAIVLSSHPKSVTRDHKPMYGDGFKQYILVSPVLCIMISPQRNFVPSQYGEVPITQHRSRKINVIILSLDV